MNDQNYNTFGATPSDLQQEADSSAGDPVTMYIVICEMKNRMD